MMASARSIGAAALAGGILLAAPLRGGALERDLGGGLLYERVRAVPADLPTGEALRRHPCVLDVRYARGGREEAAALEAWLKFHASARTPVFLLVNPRTSPALVAPLAAPAAVPGLVIIGGAAGGCDPDIPVAEDPAAERRAYAALEKGTPVEALIIERLDKPRTDEALLVREHLSDSALAEQDPEEPGDGDGPRAPAEPFDAVLQRAVQLHRALLALRRLPETPPPAKP